MYLSLRSFVLQIFLKEEVKQQSWYLDSACSRYMTGERHMFQTLTLREGGTMWFRGNQKGNIIGTCTIGYFSLSFNDVWLVDGLKHNLLSISQFCDSGCKVMFNKNICIVMNEFDKSVGFKGKRKGNVYKINFIEPTYQKVVCLLLVNDEKWVWHRRLGHGN